MANFAWITDWAAGWPAAMAELSVRAAVLLAAAWLICLLLRRHSAALRHMIWALSLLAVAATPFLGDMAPTLRIATGWMNSGDSGEGSQVAPPNAGANLAPRPTEPSFAAALRDETEAPEFEAIMPVGAGVSADAGTSLSLVSIVVAAWALGCFVFGSRLAAGHIRLRLMARRARAAENFDGLARQLGISRRVRFLRSRAEAMPMTWGWARPAVLLPADFAEWDEQRQAMTVLHELAHVKRADWLTQTFTQLVCALYWFHPLVWLAGRRIRIEADRACDDMVLRAGSKASGYAEHLVQVAREFRGAGLRPWVAIAMAHPSSLDQRVQHVLDKDVDRAGLDLGRGFAVALGVAAIAVGIPSVGALEKRVSAVPVAAASVELVDRPVTKPLRTVAPGQVEEVVVEPVKEEPILLAQAPPQPEPEPQPQLEQAEQRLEAAQRRLEERQQRAEELARRAAERAERRRQPDLSPEALQTAAAALRKALSSADAEVRAEAAESLGRLGAFDEANLEALQAALSDEDLEVRQEAAESLGRLVRRAGQMPPDQAMRWLTPALNSADAGVRREAVEALSGLSGAAAIEAATNAMDDADPGVQREAAESLGRLLRSSDAEAARAALPVLQRALQHDDPEVRREVVESLGRLRSIANDVVPLLAQAAEDPDPEVQKAAVEALGRISRRGGHAEVWREEVQVEIRGALKDAAAQLSELDIEEQIEEIETAISEFDYGTYRNIGPPAGRVGAEVGPGVLAGPEER